jgi:hypothetical protein
MSSTPSARSSNKSRPWQLARVIDRDLPFAGKLLWVKGPPEWLTVDGQEVRTIRTNVRIRGRWVYIALGSVELTRHMVARANPRNLPRDPAHPRDIDPPTYRKPPTVKPHVIAADRFKGCFAQEGRLHD